MIPLICLELQGKGEPLSSKCLVYGSIKFSVQVGFWT